MTATNSTPLPQAERGGEGRVRGQRHGPLLRVPFSWRLPLTPTLSPIARAMGERGNIDGAP